MRSLHNFSILMLAGLVFAGEVFLEEPAAEPYFVHEGNTKLTLPCVLKPQYFNQEKFELNWAHYNNGQLRILTKNDKLLVRKHSRFFLDSDSQTGNYSLVITEIEKHSVDGAYHCNVIATDDSDVQFSALATVVVLIPPGDPVLASPHQETIIEGDFYSIKCASVGGSPPPKFTWTLPNGTEADTLSYTTMFRDGVTESLLHFRVTASDNGKSIQCFVRNEAMNETETKKVESLKLDVLYKPVIVASPTENSTHLTVEEGESVDLTCDGTSNPPPHSYEWKHVPSGERYQRKVWPVKVNKSMSGLFECRAINDLGESSATLKVVVQHTPQIIVPKTISPNELDDVNVDCVIEAVPDVFDIKWIGPNGFRTNGSHLILKTISKEQSGNYTCVASNFLTVYGHSGSQQRVGTGTTIINVKRKPGAATIHARQQSVDVGKTISLKCHAEDNGNPSASYSWATPSSGEFYNLEGHDKSTLIINNAQLSDNGVYSCKAYNELGEGLTATVKITVIENARISSPLATERIFSSGEKSKLLECEAKGYPTPAVVWLKDGKPIDTLKTTTVVLDSKCDSDDYCTQTVTSSLLLPGPLKWSDKGNFTCIAENGSGIKHSNDSSWTIVRILHRPVILNKRFPEKSLAAADIASQAFIKCKVSARPEPEFQWIHRGEKVVENENHSFHTKTVNDKPDEYEQILQIESVNDNDYGDYICRVTNGNGGDQIITELQKTTLPGVPTDLRVLSTTETSILLGWEPQFDGGANQTFVVETRKVDPLTGELIRNDKDSILPADAISCKEEYKLDGLLKSTNTFNLMGLTPLSSYHVRLQAVNSRGKSEFTPVIIVTTKDVKEDVSMMAPARLIFSKTEQKLDVEPELPVEACILIYVSNEGVWRTTQCHSSISLASVISGRDYKARFCTVGNYIQCSLFSKTVSVTNGSFWKTNLLIPLVCFILVGLSLSIFFFVCCKTRVMPESSKLCPIILSPLPGEEPKIREEFGTHRTIEFDCKPDRFQKDIQISDKDTHFSLRHTLQSLDKFETNEKENAAAAMVGESLETADNPTEYDENEEDLRVVREIIV